MRGDSVDCCGGGVDNSSDVVFLHDLHDRKLMIGKIRTDPRRSFVNLLTASKLIVAVILFS